MTIALENCSPATESEIEDVEGRVGAQFPADYRSFLLHFNSGTPETNVYGDDLTVSVERFVSVSKIMTRTNDVDGFPSDAIPIAEAASGNFVYLKKGTSDIYYWDHEIDRDRKLASSFTEFLDTLRPINMDDVQLKPGQVKSVWIDPDFKPEFD